MMMHCYYTFNAYLFKAKYKHYILFTIVLLMLPEVSLPTTSWYGSIYQIWADMTILSRSGTPQRTTILIY